MAKKAITTIVAVLLVMAITLAVALSAFAFIQKTQRGAQASTESSLSTLTERWGTSGKLVSLNYNPTDNTASAVVKNNGFRSLGLNNLKALITVSNGDSCSFTLTSGSGGGGVSGVASPMPGNCPQCTGELGVGGYVILEINTQNTFCKPGHTLAQFMEQYSGMKTNILISDTYATFSMATTFVPTPIVDCELNVSRTPDQSQGGSGPVTEMPTQSSGTTYCVGYNVTNRGNAVDTFNIKAVNNTLDSSVLWIDERYDCSSEHVISQITLSPGQMGQFGVVFRADCTLSPTAIEIAAPVHPEMNYTATIASRNCGSTKYINVFRVTCASGGSSSF